MIFSKELYRSRNRDFFAELRHRDYRLTASQARYLTAIYWKAVLSILLLALTLGGVYAITAPPFFTAEARILLDDADVTSISQRMLSSSARTQEAAVQKPSDIVPEEIISNITLLKSDVITSKVVDALQLYDNPAFMQIHVSRWQRFLEAVGLQYDETLENKRRFAIDQLGEDLDITRVGRSRVLSVRYTSLYAPLASDIVNTVAKFYLLDRQSWRYETIVPLQAAVDAKVANLEDEARRADIALQQYRADNKLLTVEGATILEQQAQQVSSALTAAKVQTLGIDAKRDRIEAASQDERPDRSVAVGRSSLNWNRLLQAYTDARQLRDQISARAGPDHERVKSLDKTMNIYSALMREERQHVSGGIVSEGDIAKQRVAMLETLLSSLRESLYSSYEQQSASDQLEIIANAAHDRVTKLKDLANRLKSLLTIPDNPARVISTATVPRRKSGPSLIPIVAIAGLIGLLSALVLCSCHAAFAWFRLKDGSLDLLGLRNFGILDKAGIDGYGSVPQINAQNSSTATLHQLQVDLAARVNRYGSLVFGFIPCNARIDFSAYCSAIASMFARQGKKVVVLDIAHDRPSGGQGLENWHAIHSVVADRAAAAHSVEYDVNGGFSRLQLIASSPGMSDRSILQYKDVAQVAEWLKAEYECVILNSPTPESSLDMTALSRILTCYVVVLPDRGLSLIGAQRFLRRTGSGAARCMGGVLMQFDHGIFKMFALDRYKEA